MQYEGGAFSEENFSQIFFRLPSTVDRSEKINKYLTSVHLKPFHVHINNLGENFNPPLNFGRSAVVSYMRKVAEELRKPEKKCRRIIIFD